jgi:hypothetical protein
VVLIVADRLHGEPDSLFWRPFDEEDAVPQDAMSEQGRGIVEDDEIDQGRRHDAPQSSRKPTQGSAPVGPRGVGVEEDTDVEVAVFAGAIARAASKEESQPHLALITKGVPEAIGDRAAIRGRHRGNGSVAP